MNDVKSRLNTTEIKNSVCGDERHPYKCNLQMSNAFDNRTFNATAFMGVSIFHMRFQQKYHFYKTKIHLVLKIKNNFDETHVNFILFFTFFAQNNKYSRLTVNSVR